MLLLKWDWYAFFKLKQQRKTDTNLYMGLAAISYVIEFF